MKPNQIYLSVLRTAIKKALSDALPGIIETAVRYVETRGIHVHAPAQHPEMSPDLQKNKIIRQFLQNVKGKKEPPRHSAHDGAAGHWLERQMGIAPNPHNEPDLHGYEQKKYSSVMTYVDKQNTKFWKGVTIGSRDRETKKRYWETFQRANSRGMKIGGWKLDEFDINGQCLKIDSENNIHVIYNPAKDRRAGILVPEYYQKEENHVIGTWPKAELQPTIDNKFNQKGFYVLKKTNGEYDKICFGQPMSFDLWIEHFKKKNIYYDGYSGLKKWRGAFRAPKKFWDSFIIDEY